MCFEIKISNVFKDSKRDAKMCLVLIPVGMHLLIYTSLRRVSKSFTKGVFIQNIDLVCLFARNGCGNCGERLFLESLLGIGCECGKRLSLEPPVRKANGDRGKRLLLDPLVGNVCSKRKGELHPWTLL